MAQSWDITNYKLLLLIYLFIIALAIELVFNKQYDLNLVVPAKGTAMRMCLEGEKSGTLEEVR